MIKAQIHFGTPCRLSSNQQTRSFCFFKEKKVTRQVQGVHSVFTGKEKSHGISFNSSNDGNSCTTKKVCWNQTEIQSDLLQGVPKKSGICV